MPKFLQRFTKNKKLKFIISIASSLALVLVGFSSQAITFGQLQQAQTQGQVLGASTSPISFVQKSTVNVTSGTGIGQDNVTTSAGNTLVVLVAIRHGTSVSSVTDSAGDIFTFQVAADDGSTNNDRLEIWTKTNASASTFVKITLSSATGGDVGVLEYSGVVGIGQNNINNTTNNNPNATITTQGANNWVVGGFANQSNCSAMTAVAGNIRVNNDFDAFICLSAMDNSSVTPAATTISTTYTSSANAANAAIELTAGVVSANPPVISNIASSGLTSSAATLTWTTDISSDSQVDYGTTTSYGSSSALNSSLVTSHSVSLSGLSASILYHYRVKSSSNGNLAVSADNTFTTLATPPADTQAPTVPSSLSATAISSSQINLSWAASTDNTAVTGYTVYRGGTQIGTSATNSYSDTGLTASTAYSYIVDAFDAAGNHSAQSTAAPATTQAAPPPPPPGSYPWSGILSSSRGIDWGQAGIPGGIPSDSWTQCGPTIQPYTGAPTTIINALKHTGAGYTSCGPNTYVLLGAGDFNLSGAIHIVGMNNDELRGMGPTQTRLHFTGSSSCQGGNGTCLVGFDSSDTTYPGGVGNNFSSWTAGYAQGATQITLSNGVGIVPNSTMIVLDQCDTGYTGSPCAGSAVDNGNYFNCEDAYNPTNQTGCSFNAANGSAGRPHRFQFEMVQATSCTPACGSAGPVTVTISPGLEHPNWSASQTPQAWLVQPAQYVGVRNLLIDGSQMTYNGDTAGLSFNNDAYFWSKNVTLESLPNIAMYLILSLHGDIEQNYIYNSGQSNPNTDNSGLNWHAFATLITNNIFHNAHVAILANSTNSGNVISYNYQINGYTGNSTMFGSIWPGHSNGSDYNLYEGNVANMFNTDLTHGTQLANTLFRNFFTGWESCANGNCGSNVKDSDLFAILDLAYNRYENYVGNILGTPGVNTQGYNFTNSEYFLTSSQGYPWSLGSGDAGASPAGGFAGGPIPSDPLVAITALRWGNWDSFNKATQWNTSEVPSSLAVYPNPVPPTTLPASFYLTSRPSWWSASIPYPAMGPDVVGGNVGQCQGVLNTAGKYNGVAAEGVSECAGSTIDMNAWGGHLNTIPAMDCYLRVLNGPPDGTGAMLAFDASLCYASAGSPPPPTDTTSPTTPSSVSATAVSSSAINIIWSASTDSDNTASQLTYKVFRNGSQVGTTAAGVTSYSDTGLSAGTTYNYTVSASDPAGNTSNQSSPSVSATTQSSPDTTAPTVSILNPSSGSFTGTITVSVSAQDPTVNGQITSGLSLVTVSIDGSVFATSTSGTLSKSLDTTTLTNSSHTITAIAKDNAGNTSTTATVTITVSNASATKYPRLITLTSLEGLSAIPSNTTITATVVSPSSGATLETQSNLSATANNYTVSFLSSDPQLVNIRITVKGYLSALLTNVDTTINGSSALSVPQLLAGDLNNDNTINSLDYSVMNSHFLQSFSQADINRDGLVNSLDYAILKNNYGKSGQ